MNSHHVIKESESKLPTAYGDFTLTIYRDKADNTLIPVLTNDPKQECLVRVHSACFTGETLGSKRCDCKEQLDKAMEIIGKKGGMIIYMFQEGRGIGLLEKIKAYKLQDNGKDTVEANIELGHDPDARDYSAASEILKELGIKKIKLITNNPDKIVQLEQKGITILERVAVPVHVHESNKPYLTTKKVKMNHLI